MEGYDTLGIFPMPLEPSALLANQDTMRGSLPADGYAASDIQSIPPMLARYGSTFDDPYLDAASLYDNTVIGDIASPGLNHDSKLLDFSLPTFGYALLDYTYRRTSITLSAQLQGMFFLAETPPGEMPSSVPELTCYRRNLFSITGTITLPRSLRYIMTDQVEQIPIVSQELTLSATESVEGNPVKIISVPWKTSAAAAPPPPDDKTEREPTSMPLDITLLSNDVDPEYANFPISFKRLQFRIATANNGRRRELQQHFIIKLRVMATLSTGAVIPLCEVVSGPIVVRGRSPRNFQTKKEVPVGGGSVAGRKSTAAAKAHNNGEANATKAIKTEAGLGALDDFNVSPTSFLDWRVPMTAGAHQGARTAVPGDLTGLTQQHDGYALSSPDLQRAHQRPFLAPIGLSLMDEESGKHVEVAQPAGLAATPATNAAAVAGQAKKAPRLSQAPSFTASSLLDGDNEDAADQLYEYFPLGLDDWQEPVDAVYRHVPLRIPPIGKKKANVKTKTTRRAPHQHARRPALRRRAQPLKALLFLDRRKRLRRAGPAFAISPPSSSPLPTRSYERCRRTAPRPPLHNAPRASGPTHTARRRRLGESATLGAGRVGQEEDDKERRRGPRLQRAPDGVRATGCAWRSSSGPAGPGVEGTRTASSAAPRRNAHRRSRRPATRLVSHRLARHVTDSRTLHMTGAEEEDEERGARGAGRFHVMR